MLDGVFQVDLQGRRDDPPGVTLGWDALLAIIGSRRGGRARQRHEALRAR